MIQRRLQLHASSVAWEGRAVLICGASGSGKSSLALQMIGYGAALVSDDQSILTLEADRVTVSAPERIAGMIEARGIGLLRAKVVPSAELALVVDLDQAETERLPPWRETVLLGQSFACLHKSACPSFPAAMLQYLKAGRAM